MRSAKGRPVLELRDASLMLGGTRVLNGLTLTIRKGEHAAILGPNGAGKSSLMKLLTLDHYPLAGTNTRPPLLLFGKSRWDVTELRSRLGIVSADLHDRFVSGNTSGAIPALDAVLSGFFSSRGVFAHQRVTDGMRRRARRALDQMGVAHLSSTALDSMSTGEARRVLIARALVRNPSVLILDEPTRGLDIVARHQFMERVRRIAQGGTTLLLVTHHVDEIIPEIDRVILLQRGRIACDGTKRTVLSARRLGDVFGAPLRIERTAGYYRVTLAKGLRTRRVQKDPAYESST